MTSAVTASTQDGNEDLSPHNKTRKIKMQGLNEKTKLFKGDVIIYAENLRKSPDCQNYQEIARFSVIKSTVSINWKISFKYTMARNHNE